jgi:hypothetical protein
MRNRYNQFVREVERETERVCKRERDKTHAYSGSLSIMESELFDKDVKLDSLFDKFSRLLAFRSRYNARA